MATNQQVNTSETTETIQQALMTAEQGMRDCGLTFEQANNLFRRQQIVSTLERCKWNKCKAARELGMHRNTMTRNIQDLKIQTQPFHRKPVKSFIAVPGHGKVCTG